MRLVQEVGRFGELLACRRVRLSVFSRKVASGMRETILVEEK